MDEHNSSRFWRLIWQTAKQNFGLRFQVFSDFILQVFYISWSEQHIIALQSINLARFKLVVHFFFTIWTLSKHDRPTHSENNLTVWRHQWCWRVFFELALLFGDFLLWGSKESFWCTVTSLSYVWHLLFCLCQKPQVSLAVQCDPLSGAKLHQANFIYNAL